MDFYKRGVDSTIERLQHIADPRAHRLGWAADALETMDRPVVSYPDDDTVPVPYADAMTHDPKGRGFPQLAIQTVIVSAQAAGVKITESVFEKVKRMAMGPEAADTYLDSCGADQDERKRRHDVVIGTVRDIAADELSGASEALLREEPLVYGGLRYYGLALRTLPDATRSSIYGHANAMLHASLKKSRAGGLKEYADVARQEAEEYAHVWSHTVWAGENRPGAPEAFAEYDSWIAGLLGSMLVCAAGLDLRKDYDNGEITFKPRSFTLAKASLMAAGMRTLPRAARQWRQIKRSPYRGRP